MNFVPRENCLPHQDDLVAYSLGALDAGDVAALELHLKTCPDCQAELADYQKIVAGLLHSIPQRTPSAGLRKKIANRMPSAPKRTSSLFTVSFKQFATAAVLTILLGLNILSVMQIRSLQEQQNALAERLSTEQATIGMLVYPGTQRVLVSADLPDLTGSVLLDKDKNTAVLVLWNLPELEAGKIYQIWLVNAQGDRISAGLFTRSSDQDYTMASVQSTTPIGQFVAIGVTIEPSGGSDQPTGSRVLLADF